MSHLVELPARLDHQAARNLYAALRAAPAGDIRLDAGKVTFVGGLALQILLAAAAKWRSSGHHFACEPRSPAFADDIIRLGADPAELHEDQEPCR